MTTLYQDTASHANSVKLLTRDSRMKTSSLFRFIRIRFLGASHAAGEKNFIYKEQETSDNRKCPENVLPVNIGRSEYCYLHSL